METSGIALTVGYVDGMGRSSEGARAACGLLDTVARTLAGIDTVTADELHEEYARAFGRAKANVKKARAAGSVVTVTTEMDFAKAGVRPPLLAVLAEAGQHIFKLRKLGAFPSDCGLGIDLAKIRAKHAERWEALAPA